MIEFSDVDALLHAARSDAAEPLVLLEEQRAAAEVERAAPAEAAVNSEPAAVALVATEAEEQDVTAVARAAAVLGAAALCCGPAVARAAAAPAEEPALFLVAPWSSADAVAAALDESQCGQCFPVYSASEEPDEFRAQAAAHLRCSLAAASGLDGSDFQPLRWLQAARYSLDGFQGSALFPVWRQRCWLGDFQEQA